MGKKVNQNNDPIAKWLDIAQIVILGNFNPFIFHPQWFERYKILPIQETETPTHQLKADRPKGTIVIRSGPTNFVSPDLTHVDFPSISIDVQQDRLQASTRRDKDFSLLSDAIIKIFYCLPHTPVRNVGFNFFCDLLFDSSGTDCIKELLEIKSDKFKKAFIDEEINVGLRLKIQEEDHIINLQIEDSSQLTNGVHTNFNFHRNIDEAQVLIEIIRKQFFLDMKRAEEIIISLFGTPVRSFYNE